MQPQELLQALEPQPLRGRAWLQVHVLYQQVLVQVLVLGWWVPGTQAPHAWAVGSCTSPPMRKDHMASG